MAGRMLLHRERRLLAPSEGHAWWRSHAQCPTVLELDESLWRVYFAARNTDNQSHIVYADFDPRHDMRLLRLETEPLLDLGMPGTFDNAGMGPSAALFVGSWAYDVLESPVPIPTEFVTGCAMTISRRLLDRIGGLPECYFPGYSEDAEYSRRARDAGFQVLYAPKAIVYHKVGATAGHAKTSPLR